MCSIDFSDEQSRKNKFESSYVLNKLASSEVINKLATSDTQRESKTSDVGSTLVPFPIAQHLFQYTESMSQARKNEKTRYRYNPRAYQFPQ